MAHIVLTEEQARAVAGTEPVELHDPSGRLLAIVRPLDANEVKALEIMRRRRAAANPEPGIPADRVSAMLAKLNELDAAGEITSEKVAEVVQRVRRGAEP
jgi:hypothetical protein